jgi:hypothetical protein
VQVVTFKANGTGKQCYELRESLLLERRLKCHRFPTLQSEIVTAVRNVIPHTYVDLPPHFTIEATGVCIPIGNSKVSLAFVSGRSWSDADIVELLSFRNKPFTGR